MWATIAEMSCFLVTTLFAVLFSSSTPEYSIQTILLAHSSEDYLATLVMGAPKDEIIDTVYTLCLIRGGRNILFDNGFHRERCFKGWTIKDYLPPVEAVLSLLTS